MKLTDKQLRNLSDDYHDWEGLYDIFSPDYKEGYTDGIKDTLSVLGYSKEEVKRIIDYHEK